MKSFKQYLEEVKKPTGELKDACWKGYTAVGMKMKDGKKVPNCVPTNEGADMKAIRMIKDIYKRRNVKEEVEQIEEGMMKRMATDKEEDARLSEPPFDKPYTTTKGTVTDKSGAKHSPMSRARDLARQAAKKQSEYLKARKAGSSTKNARARAAGADNAHMFESRQMEIVKEAMKKAKEKKEKKESDETFQANPELSSQIIRND